MGSEDVENAIPVEKLGNCTKVGFGMANRNVSKQYGKWSKVGILDFELDMQKLGFYLKVGIWPEDF